MYKPHAFATLVVLVAATLVPFAAGSPARADSNTPSLEFPIHSSAPEVVVQINAGPKSWGIRRAARRMDEEVDGLTVRTSGDCATADVCVTVRVGHYNDADMMRLSEGYAPAWLGLTVYPTARDRIIYLNAANALADDTRARTAAHEFGHILGLAHHYGYGLMSVSRSYKMRAPWLSADEVTLLRGWYGNLATRA